MRQSYPIDNRSKRSLTQSTDNIQLNEFDYRDLNQATVKLEIDYPILSGFGFLRAVGIFCCYVVRTTNSTVQNRRLDNSWIIVYPGTRTWRR